MDFMMIIREINEIICGWPLMLYVVAISLIYTIALRGIQFRYFFTALKETISPTQSTTQQEGQISPFHAFMNTINSNLGNGVVAGVATAIYAGGPGAAFWFVVFGFILMAVRFGEVYLSTYYGSRAKVKTAFGGPMLYLKEVPGGQYLPHAYAFFCVWYGLIGGNLIQANSIAVSLATTWAITPVITGIGLFAFVLYILFGGAERIVKISVSIVPVKVVVFMFSSLAVLGYHYQSLWSAVCLIVSSGLGMQSVGAGLLGFSVQQMVSSGMSRSIFATESGLGSAGIMFGSTGNDNAIQNGFMGMMSTFISTCIGFIIALCIVVSGVWGNGLTSTALTISAFDTTFGIYGGWIVSFLAVSFGLGVIVSYAYVVRSTWLFFTNNRFGGVFNAIYSLGVFFGSIAAVDLVWDLAGFVMAIMLFINLYGMLLLLPKVKVELLKKLANYKA